jgi:PAS domain S-box-containing protein
MPKTRRFLEKNPTGLDGLEIFRVALANAPVGLAITDLSRCVVMLNAAAERLTGFTSQECAGGPVAVYLGEDNDFSETEMTKLLAGEPVMREIDITRKDGVEIPVQLSAAYVEAAGGGGPYLVEAYIDQTDRKRLDHLKNEFVFIAAHELRSPVSAVNLLLNLIFEDKRLTIDPIMRDYLMKLHEAEERLLQLVDDLLEVSRTEVGRLKIKVAAQDVSQHVMAVFSDFRANALSRDLTLRYDQGTHPPLVMADPTKLREVLINLISNAVKYNSPGGTVVIEHEVRGGLLATTVRDTGIGISAEDQARLFQKFWRSEDFAVRSQPGTGLGLFIIKEVVERMGGTVELKSERGHGTAVTFTLPLAPPEAKVI